MVYIMYMYVNKRVELAQRGMYVLLFIIYTHRKKRHKLGTEDLLDLIVSERGQSLLKRCLIPAPASNRLKPQVLVRRL